MKACPKCGGAVFAGASDCPSCGALFDSSGRLVEGRRQVASASDPPSDSSHCKLGPVADCIRHDSARQASRTAGR
jgi:hypothetical protein